MCYSRKSLLFLMLVRDKGTKVLKSKNKMNEFEILFLFFYFLGIRDAVGEVKFEDERLLNSYSTRQAPHCSLCSVFSAKPVSWSTYSRRNALPSSSSLIRLNILLFTLLSQEENIISLSWRQDIVQGSAIPDETSAIFHSKLSNSAVQNSSVLRCHRCLLRVHSKCYQTTVDESLPWMCDRCSDDSSISKVYPRRIL